MRSPHITNIITNAAILLLEKMMFLNDSDYWKKNESLIFKAIFFIGAFMVVFSLLRLNQWDHRELKLVCGIGIPLLLLGIDSIIKSKISLSSLAGFIISCSAVLLYYFVINRSSDELALFYAIGLALLVTDIVATNYLDGFYQNILSATESIKDEIKTTISSKQNEDSNNIKDLSEMAVDVWRLEKRLQKIGTNLPETQIKAFENSLQRLKRVLSKLDIETIDYSNQKYNEGMNLDIITIEKDNSIPYTMIREMVEPTVLSKGKIIKKGKVIIVEKN